MPQLRSTLAQRLDAAELAIRNSLAEPEIQALVLPYGYDLARLDEGRLLFERARNAVRERQIALAAQRAAAETLDASRRAAFAAYRALAGLARATLSPAAVSGLGLDGRMPRGTAAFLAAAGTLFENAGRHAILADFGYDAACLENQRACLAAFARADQNQQVARDVARQAGAEQVRALAALHKWMARYQKIARLALRDRPRLLEKIGLAGR